MVGGATEPDATGNDDGTNSGTDTVTGKVGNARSYVAGNSDYLDFGDMTLTV